MKEIKTRWANQNPPLGCFDDFICITAKGNQEKFLMRPEEFDFLAHQLFENWQKAKSAYIQILKEWNECIGFYGIKEMPSQILDMPDTQDLFKYETTYGARYFIRDLERRTNTFRTGRSSFFYKELQALLIAIDRERSK